MIIIQSTNELVYLKLGKITHVCAGIVLLKTKSSHAASLLEIALGVVAMLGLKLVVFHR